MGRDATIMCPACVMKERDYYKRGEEDKWQDHNSTIFIKGATFYDEEDETYQAVIDAKPTDKKKIMDWLELHKDCKGDLVFAYN